MRGLAVAAVVLYHLEPAWLPGGFLGVSLFFTLSGFLITNVVLAEEDGTGRVALGRFWERRVRRLLPALLLGIALAVAVAWAAGDAFQLRRLAGDVWSSLGYVTNWHFIASGDAYAAGFEAPSPLAHLWSLAIEEQFYVAFPLLAGLLVARGASRRAWLVVFGAVLAASAAATVLAYDPADTARTYFGTDTRMAEVVLGVLLAVLVRMEVPGRLAGLVRSPWIAAAPLVAAVAIWRGVDLSERWLYQGGLWAVAALSCTLVLVSLGDGPVSRLLTARPLAALGRLSYGIYLFHWPLLLWLDETRTGLDGPALALLRVAVTMLVAIVSYRLVERPIRARRVISTAVLVALVLPVAAGGLGWAGERVGAAADRRAVGDASAFALPEPSAALPLRRASATASVPPVRRVLLVGDSVAHQALPAVAAQLGTSGVEVQAVGAPGETLLTHLDEWLAELRTALDQLDPDVVVLEGCCGFGLADPSPWVTGDGRTLAVDSPELWAEWATAARRITELAMDRGAVPLWVLMAPSRPGGVFYGPIDQRIPVANDVYRDLARCAGSVGLVDLTGLSVDGAYADALPDATGQAVAVRHPDGLHFTPDGNALVARVVDQSVSSWWGAVGGRLDLDQRTMPERCS